MAEAAVAGPSNSRATFCVLPKELDKDRQEVRLKNFKKAIKMLKVVIQKKLRIKKIFKNSLFSSAVIQVY